MALTYELDLIRGLISARTTQSDALLVISEVSLEGAVEELSEFVVKGIHEQGYRLTADHRQVSHDDG